MRSKVAEEAKTELRADMMAMSPQERMTLALKLGDQAVRNLARIRGITHDEALRLVRKQRQATRRYSKCMDERNDDAAG